MLEQLQLGYYCSSPTTHCKLLKSTDAAQQSKRTSDCLSLSLPPVITNTQTSRTFGNRQALHFAWSTALQPSTVAREKSVHSGDVSAQQHLWLDTMAGRCVCSFICKEGILCITQEQHTARSSTGSLLLLHLL